MKIRREKILALFVGTCMVLTLCMVGFFTPVSAITPMDVYVPDPTGDPVTDWTNIDNAFASMSPGDTLYFAAGRYAIHKPIVTHGFHGSVIGAGMDVTFIEAVRGPLGYFEVGHMSEYDGWWGAGSEDHYTAFFYFGSPETSLAVSDLTLEVNEPDVAEMSYTYYPATEEDPEFYEYLWNNGNNIYAGIDISVATDCDTSFENIRITGLYTHIFPETVEDPEILICNPRFGLVHWYSSGGSHLVRDCVFESSGVFACGPIYMDNAEYIFESNLVSNGYRGFQTAYCYGMEIRVRNNGFYNLDMPAVADFFLEASIMKVSRNHMIEVDGGFWFNHQPWVAEGSRYLVEHNYIKLKQYCWTGGIEVWDFTDAKSELVAVNNRIHSIDATAPYGPISLNGADGSVIAFNKIMGQGPAAIYVGTIGVPATDIVLLGNDVADFKVKHGIWDVPIYWPEPGDRIKGVARIWLGESSSNCLVVEGWLFHGCKKKNVVNQGVDNIVVGVDRIGWRELFRRVADAMRQIEEMKDLFH